MKIVITTEILGFQLLFPLLQIETALRLNYEFDYIITLRFIRQESIYSQLYQVRNFFAFVFAHFRQVELAKFSEKFLIQKFFLACFYCD